MPWPRSELTIQASNEFGLDLKVPRAQLFVRKRFIRVTENEVGHIGRRTRAAARLDFSSKIILATKQDRAIDLSCRACGAGAWALGLDSRWGASAPLLLTTPNLRLGLECGQFGCGQASISERAVDKGFYVGLHWRNPLTAHDIKQHCEHEEISG